MKNNFEKIKTIISDQFGVSANLIAETANLTADLNLSELEIVDLIAKLAHEFHFQLPDDININNIKTVSDLEILVEQSSDQL